MTAFEFFINSITGTIIWAIDAITIKDIIYTVLFVICSYQFIASMFKIIEEFIEDAKVTFAEEIEELKQRG